MQLNPLPGSSLPTAPICEPFHPQLKIFSFPKLMGRVATLRLRGETVRADELKVAIERALKININLELFGGTAA